MKGATVSELSYIPLNISDFLSDDKVALMSAAEVGAYVLLLCRAWQQKTPGTLPAKDEYLSRWARMSMEEWEATKEIILMPFELNDDVSPSRYEQHRMMRDIERISKTLLDRKNKATMAANARWGKECPSNAQAVPKREKLKDKTISSSKTSKVTWSEDDGWVGVESSVPGWSEAFPNADVLGELKKMSAWLDANPGKRKKQYKRFIVNWLSGANQKGALSADKRTSEYDETGIGKVVSIK